MLYKYKDKIKYVTQWKNQYNKSHSLIAKAH